MRNFGHLTPHYVWSRFKDYSYQKSHPDHPWLTREAVSLLDRLLMPIDVGLEFGGGRSTYWFAKKLKHITTVESDKNWHDIVAQTLKSRQQDNVNLLYQPVDVAPEKGSESGYVRVVDQFADKSLTFCLVDGMYRDHCALNVLDKLAPGALLAIDNASWFMPSTSRSPNSRAPGTGGSTETWNRFMEKTESWRRIWTYSGVSTTILMFKP